MRRSKSTGGMPNQEQTVPAAGSGAAVVRGTVFNVMRYSVRDGPGLRTTVFLKGCPLRCRWCHNPESQAAGREVVFREERCIACGDCAEACPEGAIAASPGEKPGQVGRCLACGACVEACVAEARQAIGRELTTDALMEEVRKDVAFFEESGGGVTFSGGEPLAQPDFLEAILEACRGEGIHTAVDTSGAVPYELLERILPHVDLFLYDLKLMDEARHRRETGASNRPILENLRRLARAGRRITIRFPVVPGINDDDDNIAATGRFVASLNGVRDVQLLPYHKTGEGKYGLLKRRGRERIGGDEPPLEPPEPETLGRVATGLERFGLRVSTGAYRR